MQKKVQYLRTDLAKLWQGQDVFSVVQQLQGEIFRHKEGRRTLRVVLEEKSYFLKYHQGVGWPEIIKNFIQLRAPIISAKNEWQAVHFLEQHELDTMTLAAYGEQGFNPAKKRSFVMTDELVNTMSLEYVGKQWRESVPTFSTKTKLINKLASISKKMHEGGMNHRDFYLCHFLIDQSFAQHNTINDETRLFLIDLHRAQIRRKTPQRWIVKDLGGLYFSALDVALTKRDFYRFMMTYSDLTLREVIKQQQFWTKVTERAIKLRDQ